MCASENLGTKCLGSSDNLSKPMNKSTLSHGATKKLWVFVDLRQSTLKTPSYLVEVTEQNDASKPSVAKMALAKSSGSLTVKSASSLGSASLLMSNL